MAKSYHPEVFGFILELVKDFGKLTTKDSAVSNAIGFNTHDFAIYNKSMVIETLQEFGIVKKNHQTDEKR
jgi:hypothetical protein